MNRNNIAAMVLTAGAVLGLAACAPEQPT